MPVASAPKSSDQSVSALFYHHDWLSPYQVNATLIPTTAWKGRSFGATLAFSNGTALIGGEGGGELLAFNSLIQIICLFVPCKLI